MQETKEALKKTLLKALKNIGTFLKWMACACVVGVVVGAVGGVGRVVVVGVVVVVGGVGGGGVLGGRGVGGAVGGGGAGRRVCGFLCFFL